MGLAGSRAASVDVLAIQAASSTKAIIRLVQQSSQSISSNTDTAITFGAGSEEIDTAGWHDVATNTSRITPTTPGYVALRGTVWWAADTDDIAIWAAVGKNGTIVERFVVILPSTATASVSRTVAVSCRQSCNGTGDYFELFGKQLQATPGALSTSTGAGLASTFELEFLRGL